MWNYVKVCDGITIGNHGCNPYVIMYIMYEISMIYVHSMSIRIFWCNYVHYEYIIHNIVCKLHNTHNAQNTHITHDDRIQT